MESRLEKKFLSLAFYEKGLKAGDLASLQCLTSITFSQKVKYEYFQKNIGFVKYFTFYFFKFKKVKVFQKLFIRVK
jgi:hypothetical protein